jgi:hypothetical protein
MADIIDTAHDNDETRRLLYMALVVNRTKKYNLAGTLINALRHHQGVTDADLEDRVISCIENIGPIKIADGIAVSVPDDDEAWLRDQIQRCTERKMP